jgi:AraC-like DNA-binding protein
LFEATKIKCNGFLSKKIIMFFSVTTVGFQSIQPNVPYPLNRHPKEHLFDIKKGRVLSEYQFLYITNGTGVIHFESSNAIPVHAGQIVLIRPNQWHSYWPIKESGWDEYYIGFCSLAFKDILDDSISIIEDQIINIGLNAELVDLFRRAIEISESETTFFKEYLQGITAHIIGLILAKSQGENRTNDYSLQIVEKAKIIMSENVFASLSPVELALKLEMNYVSFRKLFKKITGFAPAKYLMALKMQKAEELLLKSASSIKKISSDLGFDSPDSFNKAFKKSTGETGTEYRLNCRRAQ